MPYNDADAIALHLCVCCTLAHANDDTCDCPPDAHPTGLLGALDGYDISLGGLDSEHYCDDPAECRDNLAEYGEGCERDTFSRVPCDGCGSHHEGYRQAATAWPPRT